MQAFSRRLKYKPTIPLGLASNPGSRLFSYCRVTEISESWAADLSC
jgi:hypothetical protein